MSDTKRGDRVRVVIAGSIYTKHALVKGFLADDGFRVVAEAATRPELGAALESTDPDAVVVDDRLLADEAGIASIRRKAPSAKIVVFTSGPEQKPVGADGYLEKGVGLAALTVLLGRLCSDPTVPMNTVPLAGVGARAAESPVGPTFSEASSEREHREPRSALRAGAIGIGTVIVIVLASTLFSGGGSLPVGHPRANSSGGPILGGHSPSALELAQNDLRKLRDALVSGSYVSARVYAQSLMRNRDAAITFGLSIGALDERIRELLSPVMSSLAPRVISFLRDTLGELLPPVPSSGGGGSGGGPTDTGEAGGSTGSTGSTGSGSGSGSGSGEGDDEHGGGDDFPGQGKHLGWVNKPPQGGWHGHKPK